VWLSPALTAVHLAVPGLTWTGDVLALPAPIPNWPALLSPQHHSDPSPLFNAQVW
jgi:hypothetical protein